MDKRRSKTKPPAEENKIKSTTCGEDLHVDIVYVRIADGKSQLFLLFVDQASKYMIAVKLKRKDAKTLAANSVLVAKMFKLPKVTIHSDQELGLSASKLTFLSEGSTFVQVGAGTHERVVERAVKTIRGKFRAILYSLDYQLPKELYPYLFEYIVFVNNITANKILLDKLPLEALKANGFNTRYLNYEFGQLGYFHNPNAKEYTKQGEIGILIGWNDEASTVLGYLLENKQVVNRSKFVPTDLESLPVKIKRSISQYSAINFIDPPNEVSGVIGLVHDTNKSQLPLLVEGTTGQAPEFQPQISNNDGVTRYRAVATDDSVHGLIGGHEVVTNRESLPKSHDPEAPVTNRSEEKCGEHYANKTILGYVPMARQPPDIVDNVLKEVQLEYNTSLREGLRKTRKRDYKSMAGFADGNAIDPNSKFEGVSDKVPHSESDNTQCTGFTDNVLPVPKPHLQTQNSSVELINLHEGAIFLTKDHLDHRGVTKYYEKGPERKAIEKELKQMIDLKVWETVAPEQVEAMDKTKLIPSKLFTTNKFGPDGLYIKTKARLVAGGHRQHIVEGDDVFSPTVRHETVLVNLNRAAYLDLEIDCLDVTGAFLLAPASGEIHIVLDVQTSKYLTEMYENYKRYLRENGTIVVRLIKSMYGLKQSSRQWFNLLAQVLRDNGYVQSQTDSAMFIKTFRDETKHIVLCYVDDILSIGRKEQVKEFQKIMKNRFQSITVNENPNAIQYIGMMIRRKRESKQLFIHQPGYLEEILKDFKIGQEDISPTPSNEKLFFQPQIDPLVDAHSFRSKLMKLMFLTKTRPDIKLPVIFLTTRMQSPTKSDEEKLKRIAQYLNGTKELGITIKPNSLFLFCSADASYASHSDLKGHTGITIGLGEPNAPIFTASKKQKLITRSSTEAEILALESATSELIWTKNLLEELGHKQESIPIEQDNKSAMLILQRGPGKMGKSKSFQVKYYWITEKVQDKTIQLKYVPSKAILADGLTKPLIGSNFYEWRRCILNMD